MNELYWITRLDAIDNLFTALSIIFCLVFAVFMIASIVCNHLSELDYLSYPKYKLYNKKWSRRSLYIAIVGGCLCLLFTILTILTPNTKEAYLIYGVGGSIDYLKENDTAKQLPDKVLKAIDSWIDYTMIENKKDSIN